ncbi:MAG TPA: sulfite exporter TauE/SafE family protein [Victivallales bacterium]|nr:sulfite exporter TauE/SafE family protein [Victivallales bacterium]
MKRVDFKAGLLFSCTVIPGAVFGAISVEYIPRNAFDLLFGIILVSISIFLIFKPELTCAREVKTRGIYMLRNITDADGINYIFSFNPILGLAIGLIVGFLSSLLGIGGGIIHVPALVHFLDYPVHLATATSHFMLAIMSLSGSMVHVFSGALKHGWLEAVILGAGVIIGAPIGARLSNKLHGKWIIRSLAIALALVGVRILFTVV